MFIFCVCQRLAERRKSSYVIWAVAICAGSKACCVMRRYMFAMVNAVWTELHRLGGQCISGHHFGCLDREGLGHISINISSKHFHMESEIKEALMSILFQSHQTISPSLSTIRPISVKIDVTWFLMIRGPIFEF